MQRLFRGKQVSRARRDGDAVLVLYRGTGGRPTILHGRRRYHERVPFSEYRDGVVLCERSRK